MAARSVGKWYRLGELIKLFEQMGCEVYSLPGRIVDQNGLSFTVRYILNHDNGRFVAITDLDEDDKVPGTEVENWMRQLDMSIPLPPIGP